ncbi:hypothetical protein ACA910_012900 [Epithemia clementina (nom. ined.)]
MAKQPKIRPHRKSQTSSSDSKFSGTRGRVKEIVFDPEARRQHLRGFSDRKRQRRAFGLAMQKVKERNGKLEARRERNKALNEQVETAEQQKEQLMNELLTQSTTKGGTNETSNPADNEATAAAAQVVNVTEYKDQVTQDQWGGHVIVTASTHIPDDDESCLPDSSINRPKRSDEAQEYAGKVEKYLGQLKGNMPAKKRKLTYNNNQRGGKETSVSAHGKTPKYGQPSTTTSKADDRKKKRRASRK